MSLFRKSAIFMCVAMPTAGCYTFELNKDTSLSASGYFGVSWPVRDSYKNPLPAVDPTDFYPNNNTMTTSESSGTPLEANFILELRERLDDHLYMGVTSTYASIYSKGVGMVDFGFPQQTLRYTTLHWWDDVLANDVVIKRSPSIGYMIGFMFGSKLDKARGMKEIVQYTVSVRRYEVDLQTYHGIDCYGCKNTSEVKDTKTISSGAAWRHTLTIGPENCSGVVWLETADAYMAMGLGVALSYAIFPHQAP